jgi:hypothetical protein
LSDKHSNIEDLFSDAFENYEEHSPFEEQELIAIQNKVNKISFGKFSLKRFNIYYASSIVISLTLSVIVFVDYFFLQPNPSNNSAGPTMTMENVFQDSTQTESGETASTDLPSDKNVSLKKTGGLNKKNGVLSTAIYENTTELTSNPTTPLDSVASNTKPDTTSIIATPKPKKKRIVYQIKSDTIVVYDTIKTKK